MANQQFKDYITSLTEDTAPDIATDFWPIYDASATTTKKVKIESIRTRMFASGSIDGGGLTSFEIPNSAAPTVDADGKIAVDTSVTDFSHGLMRMFAGEEQFVISVPVAALASPTNGHVIKYNATNDEFELGAAAGGIGGSTGSTDNAILRADGTGGSTVQSSNVTITDAGIINGFAGSSVSLPGLNLGTADTGIWQEAAGQWSFVFSGVRRVVNDYSNNCVRVDSAGQFTWSNTSTNPTATNDVGLGRSAAGVLKITNSGSGAGALEMQEMTAPSAPATNNVRIYAEDNGSGKTRLMALFPTGAAQQIAIEP